ncbi:hypothetical protein TRFO_22521 [Tritrichomonas foetus]|uniref:Aminotransferase class V domain-containing protein n=1 Tax=Tritrichomonas foetus TaxID=1144522 RepID=A0A1J4KHP6_9EUKA|nr:hypothetical protein TRFO_22521 [Tritrichomonas foetus]|eukprot:OHT08853.1 hypothetical protein TRFO_22521 [Tritrichomonas foetus]
MCVEVSHRNFQIIATSIISTLIIAIIILCSVKKPYQSTNEMKNLFSISSYLMSIDGLVNYLRKNDFSNLNHKIKLNCATHNFITDSQIMKYRMYLNQHILGNINSNSFYMDSIRENIEFIRSQIYTLFSTNSQEYSIIFSESLNEITLLFLHSFPWTSKSTYYVHEKCDNWFFAFREYLSNYDSYYLPINQTHLNEIPIINENTVLNTNIEETPTNLFVFNMEDSFTGDRTNHSIIKGMLSKSNNSLFVEDEITLIYADAKSYASNTKLNLTEFPFHAIGTDFEKMFGLPKISCLLVKNSVLPYLKIKYSSNRNVLFPKITTQEEIMVKGSNVLSLLPEPIESLISLNAGFKLLRQIPIENIESRVRNLSTILRNKLAHLKYHNGQKMISFYHNEIEKNKAIVKGPIISMNINNDDGSLIPYSSVILKAKQNNIVLEGGCFHALHSCFHAFDVPEPMAFQIISESCNQIPKIHGDEIGSIRISLGWASTENDIENLVKWIRRTYLT